MRTKINASSKPRIEDLQRISADWMQAPHESAAQMHLLNAMAEAAEMLLDTDSDIEIDKDESEE